MCLTIVYADSLVPNTCWFRLKQRASFLRCGYFPIARPIRQTQYTTEVEQQSSPIATPKDFRHRRMVSHESKIKRTRLMLDNPGKYGDTLPNCEIKVNTGENVESSCKVAEQGTLTLKTACSPKQFKETVSGLSYAKKNAIIEMGFGPLLRLECIKLYRELCQMLVDNFNVERCSIKIHGTIVCINEGDFQSFMGVRDGGTPVYLESHINPELMKDVMSRLSVGNEELSIEWLKKIITESKVADDTFKVCFVIYALAILLCPSTPGWVDLRFLFPLRDPRLIGTNNWASFCFRHLLEGISSYQKSRSGYMNGCILFLQLIYFDSVAYSTSIVSKSIEPFTAWTRKRSRSLIKWIIGMGGFHCSGVKVMKRCSEGTTSDHDDESNDVSPDFHSSNSEDTFNLMSEISDMNCDVTTVSSMLGYIESIICTMRNNICEVDRLVVGLEDDAIECIVYDVMKAIKSMRTNSFDISGNNSMENTDPHDCGTAIRMETEPREARKNNDHFPSTGHVSRKDLKMLKFLFSKGSKGIDNSRVEIARFGEISLTHSDFQCLLPTIPLSIKVINIYAAYLSEQDSNSWFLPTYFGELATSKYDSSNVHAYLVSAIIECGLHRFNRRLKKCDEIFVPLYDEIAGYWFILVMKLQEKLAEIWDSQRDDASSYRRREKARSAVSLLQRVFVNDMTKRGDIYYNFESFPVTFPDVCPSFDNNFDSGLYIIRQMQRYPPEWFIGFKPNEQRTLIALEIVNNITNKVVKSKKAVDEGHKGHNNSFEGFVRSPNHMPSNNDHPQDGVLPTTNPPAGRKCRSHRKRRAPVMLF